MTFEDALSNWKTAQDNYVAKREGYRSAYAAAYIASTGKTADLKKSEADVATSEARKARDDAETLATVAWNEMLFARGMRGEPGSHSGQEAA